APIGPPPLARNDSGGNFLAHDFHFSARWPGRLRSGLAGAKPQLDVPQSLPVANGADCNDRASRIEAQVFAVLPVVEKRGTDVYTVITQADVFSEGIIDNGHLGQQQHEQFDEHGKMVLMGYRLCFHSRLSE